MSNYGWTTVPPPADKLDFTQAMRDFATMFPTLSHAEIESTLRRHNGSVDDTIDELLMLATNSPGASTSSVHLPPPPSYDAAVSDTVPALATHDPFGLNVLPTQMESFSNAAYAHDNRSFYEPPLLGPLPDDFLRVGSVPESSLIANSIDHYYDTIQSVHDPLPYSSSRQPIQSASKSQYYNVSTRTGAPNNTYLGVLSMSNTRPSNHVTNQSRYATPSTYQTQDLKRQARALKDLMTENQFQRASTNDPELSQYLDDEAIAIMMQNKEFMGMLKDDREFMASIARDTEMMPRKTSKFKAKRFTDCAPVPDGPPVSSAPRSVRPDEPPLPDAPSFNSAEEKFKEYGDGTLITGSALPEHSALGYGYDDPFPYTKYVPGHPTDDRTLKDKLTHMSKASKQKFALLARKFNKRSSGAKAYLGAENSKYDNLLTDGTDDIYQDSDVSWHRKEEQDKDKIYRSGYDQ